jgi:hypothetical protein
VVQVRHSIQGEIEKKKFDRIRSAFSRHVLGANGSSHDSSALPLQGICARCRCFRDEFLALFAGYFCRSHGKFSDFIRAGPKVRSTVVALASTAVRQRWPALLLLVGAAAGLGDGCGIEHGDDPQAINRWCRVQPVLPRHP